MSFLERVVNALAEMAENIDRMNAIQQKAKEDATLAHLRDEEHDTEICGMCANAAEEIIDKNGHNKSACGVCAMDITLFKCPDHGTVNCKRHFCVTTLNNHYSSGHSVAKSDCAACIAESMHKKRATKAAS